VKSFDFKALADKQRQLQEQLVGFWAEDV